MNINRCKDFFISNKFNNFTDFEKMLSRIDDKIFKGDLFEYFNYIFFSLRKDKYQIKKTYLFDNIPSSLKNKYNLVPKTGKERGCDGIVIHSDGTIFSYQTKFVSNRRLVPINL